MLQVAKAPSRCVSEAAYLADERMRFIEYDHGRVEILPMPKPPHQTISGILYRKLADNADAIAGRAFYSPVKVRLWEEKYREPDIVVLLPEHVEREQAEFLDGADLVVEIVSDTRKDRERDLETKRHEYEKARIPEYWIVDPQEQRILVLSLDAKGRYRERVYIPGQRAASVLLKGFSVDVAAVFAAAKAKRR